MVTQLFHSFKPHTINCTQWENGVLKSIKYNLTTDKSLLDILNKCIRTQKNGKSREMTTGLYFINYWKVGLWPIKCIDNKQKNIWWKFLWSTLQLQQTFQFVGFCVQEPWLVHNVTLYFNSHRFLQGKIKQREDAANASSHTHHSFFSFVDKNTYLF